MTGAKHVQRWARPETWSSPRFFAVVYGAFLVMVAVFGIVAGFDADRAVRAVIPATLVIVVLTAVRANTLRRDRRG